VSELLRVVAGSPTPEEVAAVTAVLAATEAEAQAHHDAEALPSVPSEWSSAARVVRRPLRRGPGAWRSPVR
jgi:hypothetical protein